MKTFAKAPLALAVAALFASSYALATDYNDMDSDAYLDVDVENDITVELGHESETDIWVELDMKADVLDPDHFSSATVDRKQFSDDNTVYDDETVNNTSVNGSGLNAAGNTGVNMASGGLNAQANDAAISKGSEGTTKKSTTYSTWYGSKTIDESYDAMVFAKAATFSIQSSSDNSFDNDGTDNDATAINSFNGAAGNLGVNMVAGFGNGQHNGMALAVGQHSSAEAVAVGVQSIYDNELDNDVDCGCNGSKTANNNNSSLTNSFNSATGNVGVNIASGNANMQSNTLSIARSK